MYSLRNRVSIFVFLHEPHHRIRHIFNVILSGIGFRLCMETTVKIPKGYGCHACFMEPALVEID